MKSIVFFAVAMTSLCCVPHLCAHPADKGPQGQSGVAGRRLNPPGQQARTREDLWKRPNNQADAAKIVTRLIQRFDTDGDKKLDAQELAKLLQQLRARGMQGDSPSRSASPSPLRARNGKQTVRKGSAGKAIKARVTGTGEKAAVGGDRPARPKSK